MRPVAGSLTGAAAHSEDYLLPVPVLAKMFRGKMLAMLKAAHADGRLQFFGPHADLADKSAFKAWLEPLYDTKWHVYAKRPFAGPEAVLAYLARYTHRVAISNSRLISADQTGVTFRYKDYRIEGPDRYKTMTLAPAEFIRRFMLHVLPKGFHRIRHYGLLASSGGKAETIARARELIAVAAPAQPPQPTKLQQAIARHRGDRQADPSLPMLRWSHDHHRDVRGGLDAATSSHRVGDRHQGRHVMTPIAPRSPDNAAAAVLLVDVRQRRCSASVSIGPMQQTSKSLRSGVLDAGLADHRTDATHSRRQRPLHRPPAARPVPTNSP